MSPSCRVVLFTGKGGVGKTTCAAATAVHAADGGARVLITSTDPAHSLADVLDMPLGDQPTPVSPGLDAQQIDAHARLERHWTWIRDYLARLLTWGGIEDVQAQELLLLPGFDEVFALLDLDRLVHDGGYDVIIVDCAPTAATLRLLALPDALSTFVRRVLQPGRRVARVVRPVASRLGGLPIPEDEVFTAVDQLQARLGAVHRMLHDPEVASVRLVVNPQRLVVNESLRLATSLALFGYPVDAVVANRVLAGPVRTADRERGDRRHDQHLQTIHARFAPTPILQAPLLDDEALGVDALATLGTAIYAGRDPAAVLHHGETIRLEATDDGHVLVVPLPFAHRDEVDLHRRGTDLQVEVGAQRRTIVLPAMLESSQVQSAAIRDGRLEVRFVPNADPVATAS